MSPPTAQSRPRQGGLEVISGGSGFDVLSMPRQADGMVDAYVGGDAS